MADAPIGVHMSLAHGSGQGAGVKPLTGGEAPTLPLIPTP